MKEFNLSKLLAFTFTIFHNIFHKIFHRFLRQIIDILSPRTLSLSVLERYLNSMEKLNYHKLKKQNSNNWKHTLYFPIDVLVPQLDILVRICKSQR